MEDSRKGVNALDGRIREEVCRLEDVIESHLLKQIFSQSEESIGDHETHHPLLFSIDLQDLVQDTHSFAETVKKMGEEYAEELDNPLPVEQDDVVPSRIDLGGSKSKMVGLSDVYDELKDRLIHHERFEGRVIVSLVGMAGVGKTTLAKEIFEDPLTLSQFDCRAWVTIGKKCQLDLRGAVAQVDCNSEQMLMEGDKEIVEHLEGILKGRRYLIVLDDVWNSWVWRHTECLLPDENNGSRVLLTTRLQEVAEDTDIYLSDPLKIRLLNEEESWELLREKVFAEELCPSQLEKAGKKIAKYCEGLPLTITTVANLLSEAKRSPQYWSEIAASKGHQLFIDAYDEILKVLYPSYEYLTQKSKVCFLYMGVFPQNYEIHKSKLVNMWDVEGFFKQWFEQRLNELIYNNLVMFYQESAISAWVPVGVKTCGLHSSMWHLCKKEATKNKFFHILNNYADGLVDDIKDQRRLCIHNNILFSIKEVYNSMKDNCASTARSLLCFGPYHRYPVPICFGLRLLRVLDALTIRLYEFPMQVLKLFWLKFLALTCNGELPSSISKLWNLQFLIVRRHVSIKLCRAQSYLPMRIWDLKELKHLQIMGSDLQDPSCGILLPNLLTLLDMSVHSCTKGVFERTPNLKRLGIRIELVPNGDEPLSCFDHISHLTKLQSLKCVIPNPKFGSEFVLPPASLSMLPSSLEKLSLSGCGYSWEYMRMIASLPNLQALKLRSSAFRGPKWETEGYKFCELRYLLIEDTNLVQWKVGHGSFPLLRYLTIKHCYGLEELHWKGNDDFLEEIEIVDCNPLVVSCAMQIKEASLRREHNIDVHVHSSWNDGNLKTRIAA